MIMAIQLTLALLLLHLLVTYSASLNILVIFPHIGKSHLLVFLPLFHQLANKGHNLTLLSLFPDPKFSNYRQVALYDTELKGGDYLDLRQIKGNRWEKYGTVHLLASFAEETCSRVLSNKNLQNFLQENNKFDLILVEYFNTNCHMGIVKKFNAPVIGLSTCVNPPWVNDMFGQPDHPAYVPQQFLDHSDRMTFLERVESTLLGLYFRAVFKYFMRERGNEYSKRYLGEDLLKDGDVMYNASLLLVNNHFTLNRPKPLPPNVVEVGGIHIGKPKKLPESFQKFLDEAYQGVIYMSMGTMLKGTSFPEEKRKNFLKVFSKLSQRVIWKWESDIMEGKQDNIMVTKWAPQRDILCHPNVKVFISHGGLLGTLEAVHCGVPILVMPQFGDQHVNARAIEASGGGIIFQLSEATESNVELVLKKLLSEKFQESAKDLSSRFRDRPLSPMDTAIYWIEYVAKHKGAKFLRTVGADMPTYQYFLVDVIGFVTVVISITVYINFLLIKFVYNKLFKVTPLKVKTN